MENEFVHQVKEDVSAYGEALTKLGKLRLIGVISRILGTFLMIFTIVLLVFALFSFCAVAIINALSIHMPVWAAALIMGGFYILLIIVIIACRKPLFVYPFIRLMAEQVKTEEELALKTLEAEHEAELQRFKITNQIENTTREWRFYTGIIHRIWSYLSGKLRKS